MKKAIEGTKITFTFSDNLQPVVFDAEKTHAAMQERAMMHGFAARIGDNAAIQKSAENGFTVTEAMRREAVLELVAHYEGGAETWETKARKAAPINPAITKIAELRKCTYAEAQAWFNEKLIAEMQGLLDAEAK